jgi:hypothetical protein
MTKKFVAMVVIGLMISAPSGSSAGWKDWLDKITGKETQKSTSAPSDGNKSTAGLTQSEVINGLKEALQKGSAYAVSTLGKSDGFLGNARVRIPMPDSLKAVEKNLRRFGMGRYADEFVTTMNRAAENAVVEAKPVFTRAIKQMTIEDGLKILKGPDDSATRYFREKTSDELHQKMLPITKNMTAKAGVTSSYKKMMGKLSFMNNVVGEDARNIDQYITRKTLDGLFLMIAEEERKIRKNPVSRTTDLLKKVFGKSGL